MAGVKYDDCAACRARYRYWDKKSPGKRIARRQQLERSAETMREFVHDRELTTHVTKEFKKEKRSYEREHPPTA